METLQKETTVSDDNVTVETKGQNGAPLSADAEVAAPPSDEEAKPPRIQDIDDDAPFEEDGRADQALDFVVAVLTKMGLDCTVDLMENEAEDPPTDIRIEVTGRDANRLIGNKGETLAAMQFLTNRVINRPTLRRRHILIDADGYRARREGALSSMAQRLGEQAVAEGKIITFEPMSAQDRRVVHLALAKFPGVVTKSEGKGATRRVQIIPVRE
jgi:spoIIIJ-associated protein